jgi:hypothetical protein
LLQSLLNVVVWKKRGALRLFFDILQTRLRENAMARQGDNR